jgi:hypothetical protein
LTRAYILITVALALAGLATAGATAAEAYHLGGRKWPTRTITYHSSAKQYKSEVREAVRLWNTSGVKIRFKAVKRSKARLRIVPRQQAGGLATLGYTGIFITKTLDGAPLTGNVPCGTKLGAHRVKCKKQGPTVWLGNVSKSRRRQAFYRHDMLLTVVHELGHVLGLKHNHPACAAMSYRRDKTCPQPPVPWQYRCRMIERDDLEGALERYGGRAKPLAPEFCLSYPPPAAPTGLSAAYDDFSFSVAFKWVNGTSANVARVHGTLSKDKCAVYTGVVYDLQKATPGTPGSASLQPTDGPGRYCVTVWSTDRDQQAGPAVSTWIDVPE